jgi:hypothetical protein
MERYESDVGARRGSDDKMILEVNNFFRGM